MFDLLNFKNQDEISELKFYENKQKIKNEENILNNIKKENNYFFEYLNWMIQMK